MGDEIRKTGVFQNGVVNRILIKEEEVAEIWRKLLSKKLVNFYTSLNIRAIKSRR